jgi:hypothetical protein
MAQEDGESRELQRVRRRLDQWRRQHGGPGRPIPESLWAQAAGVARAEGVAATARRLGLDRWRLERRVAEAPAPAPAPLPQVWRDNGSSADFVELDSSRWSLAPSRTVVRLESPDGERLQVESSEPTTPIDVVALAGAFLAWTRTRVRRR